MSKHATGLRARCALVPWGRRIGGRASLSKKRGVFTAPLNFWNSNVATHRFSVFTLYSQGERRGWPWRRRGHGPRTGSHKVHESNGWDRAEAIFYVQMNRFYVGQVFGKRLASGCGDRARARIIDDLFAGHRPYQSSHEKNVY